MDPGQTIASTYLSKLGWAREWRRNLNRELYPAARREDLEEKERQVDRLEEEAEAYFSTEYEILRKQDTPEAKQALRSILNMLGHRTDLGFIGKRIVDRIRRTS
ncbi:MAG: hypothetical protein ABIJ26_01520 [Candidatus Margulisiibacteriota bacterium]|nr:hypothetical protein [Candidatus Margulisiibacteriota bacterium]